MKDKILIGLSGGVDSSVSLKILKDKGYEVEALYMKNWDEDDYQQGCNAKEDLEYALDEIDKKYNRITEILDIPVFFDSPEIKKLLYEIEDTSTSR